MQINRLNQIPRMRLTLPFFLLAMLFTCFSHAQVNSVTFGRNRVQYKTFQWEYFQTDNFNVYFSQQGESLGKFVLQTAEEELPQIETQTEYGLQRRVNIVVYNNYTEFQQTNIGLQTDVINTGGTTKLVNNKMLVYFNGNHEHLKTQIRQGIARVIVQNMLFGDDLGEVASNQSLLDLPEWFTEGYIAYVAQRWSTELDDALKSEMLSDNYTKFTKFCAAQPKLAGHAFWYYLDEKYKKENTTYFMYLCRTYKNINKACLQITQKNMKGLMAEFMEYQQEKYYQDIAKRSAYPKGSNIESFDISPRINYTRFNVNPNLKDNSYVVTQFKKGIVRVIFNQDYTNKTIIKFGIRSYENEIHPNYPLIAWDPKGTKFSVIYAHKGKLLLLIYDAMNQKKQFEIDLTKKFDQIQDMNYMMNNRTLLLSAVKNGHSDIYSFDIEKETITQITNDVYDDLDPTFVSFPSKTGILFASNRPAVGAPDGDTVLPGKSRFNVFMVTNFGADASINQITQLTNLKYGNARFPAQYNNNHFTFVADENGIGNRYAGFFTTRKLEPDTIYTFNGELFRNPTKAEFDSLLQVYQTTEPDSTAIVSISQDSAYSFPITNYPSSLAETRTAGDARLCSEVTRQSDEKILFKLKVDEQVLTKRNINTPPTTYGKQIQLESRRTTVANPGGIVKPDPAVVDAFQHDFEDDTAKTGIGQLTAGQIIRNQSVLTYAKRYRYKPVKFSTDFGSVGFNTTVLFNRFQPYGGGSGPIMLSSNTPLNGLITLGASDLMEDFRIIGGFKIGTNLKDNEWLVSFQNARRRIDWGATYYRNAIGTGATGGILGSDIYPAKLFTNIYQVNAAFPFDETKSIRVTTGLRSDNLVVLNVDEPSSKAAPQRTQYAVSHLEYVYDNCLKKSTNILHGLRYKAFIDWNLQVSKYDSSLTRRPATFNVGFDVRHYYPLFKNVTWAVRGAGDFSWGSQKFIYYLGGVDGWIMLGNNTVPGSNRERYFTTANRPADDQTYAFQSLAVNLRGYIQNASNGNNAVVINSEIRMPVMSTLFDKTVNNAFLRDLQLTQFIDLGTAWNGKLRNINRPEETYTTGAVTVRVKTKGVGPFLGGYGFGARSTLLGYFVRYDVGWPMTGFFSDRAIHYLSLGLDF